MRRSTKRIWEKFVRALLPVTGFVGGVVYFSSKLFEESFHLDAITHKIVFIIIIISIVLCLSFLLGLFIYNISKPETKYFELIDFEQPSEEVIRKAAEGILNFEKTQPYFVHVAPISDEILQLYNKLDEKGFVWENGHPGDGKTMLAYHALYRYTTSEYLYFASYKFTLFKHKYRIYKLNISRIKDEKEIGDILDELDVLKGGNRKIILVDDAHKLSFEDELMILFELEANNNGKFIWINTNFIDSITSENVDAVTINFEKFYPKIVREFYESQHPVIKEIVNKYNGLDIAKKLMEKGEIKDAWQFNFVATNGEKRIVDLLAKLSDVKEEQDVLLLSVFLFSVRNVVTGEKEITYSEFINLLILIDDPLISKVINEYGPKRIIDSLSSQEKGRFFIIKNKSNLDKGFLQAPHVNLSYAVIKGFVYLLFR